eukprot:471734-Pleurochrysis_carterae.AAC.1
MQSLNLNLRGQACIAAEYRSTAILNFVLTLALALSSISVRIVAPAQNAQNGEETRFAETAGVKKPQALDSKYTRILVRIATVQMSATARRAAEHCSGAIRLEKEDKLGLTQRGGGLRAEKASATKTS